MYFLKENVLKIPKGIYTLNSHRYSRVEGGREGGREREREREREPPLISKP